MKHFSTQDFAILDKQYRAKLINSLSGFKSANLVGTQDALGITNFFLEVHELPDSAPSDGPNMLRLENFERVVRDIISYSYSSTD